MCGGCRVRVVPSGCRVTMVCGGGCLKVVHGGCRVRVVCMCWLEGGSWWLLGKAGGWCVVAG